MRPITDSPAETTIDRDLDQTAKHVHHVLGNEGCPTCKAVAAIHAPAKTFSGGNEIDLACDVDLGERVDEGNVAEGFTCDACGTSVTTRTAIEVTSDLSGRRYQFCCERCSNEIPFPRADDGKYTAEISRPVSPAILEFRIKQLGDELDAMKSICGTKDIRIDNLTRERDNMADLYKQACKDRDAATFRVRQFERFTDILANHLDALQAISNPANPRTNEYPKAA